MKKLLTFACSMMLSAGALYAQENLKLNGGGSMGKKAAVPKIEKLAIAQATVYFKNATTREFLKNERGAFGGRKSLGGTVSGRLTAYLETTDGDLTREDYQELADNFYTYLHRKLSSSGIPPVEWSRIATAKFYTADGEPRPETAGDESKKNGQIYTVVNANSGNTLYNFNPFGGINPGFAFGKAKRAMGFAEDLGATTAYLHVVVDFADIILDGDVHTGEDLGYGPGGVTTITKTKNFSFNAKAGANVKVAANNGISYFLTHKGGSDNIMVVSDISSGIPYASRLSQDENKAVLKKPIFSFGKDFKAVPVVVETTKAAYKKAAAAALERYADQFVTTIVSNRKS